MADFVGFIEVVKKAALDAVKADKPTAVMFGKVISAAPLKINVEQKMTLESPQLILARNVTDHTIEMTVDHVTEQETQHVHAVSDTYTGGGSSQPTQHLHRYAGRKKFKIHNGLVVGDEVILLQLQGGQKFLVLDRLGGFYDSGYKRIFA